MIIMIYTYVEREREIKRCVYVCVYIYIYICIKALHGVAAGRPQASLAHVFIIGRLYMYIYIYICMYLHIYIYMHTNKPPIKRR